MIYACCDQNRRAAILSHPSLNGIDYLEIPDATTLVGQCHLELHCLKPAPQNLTTDNVLIAGGESITGITATSIQAKPAAAGQASLILEITTSVAGEFSPYTLSLVNSLESAQGDSFAVTEVLDGFDPQLAQVTFSFKVDCGPYFDCKPPAPDCAPATPTPPPINYLAKDYGTFRQILLDRMNQLLPNWGAATEADLGVVLAELVAYAGDQLSYQQDAVATEAYLLTARSRISLRRHALLVDYRVHDGANARAFVCVEVRAPMFMDHTVTRFYTITPGAPATLLGNEQAALDAGVVVFEPMQDANLFPELNTTNFYTWGDLNCCLPQAATEATLAGSYPNLQAGDVLIFKEVMGPQTGAAADADIRHRYAVRLTAVTTLNGQGQPLVDPLFDVTGAPIVNGTQQPQPVTEIQWSADDALPAPLCLSSTFLADTGDLTTLINVSVAMGNVVLADHGLSMPATPLPVVPESTLNVRPSPTADRCTPTQPSPLPVRYRPQLIDSPVTQAVPLEIAGSPVTTAAVPLVTNGLVSLPDSNGYTALMLGANNVAQWPQWFGVQATLNPGPPESLTLQVVFSPPGMPPGTLPVVLETFANLSSPAEAIDQINAQSQLIVASAAAETTLPGSVAAGPTMLLNQGPVSLLDEGSMTAYLTVQPTNTATWPPLFAVVTQGNLSDPTEFNVLLLYNSPFGAVGGAQLPAVLLSYSNVSLATAATMFAAPPSMLRVATFEEQPNPALSAYDLMNYDPAAAVPVITLTSELNGAVLNWTAAPDLLADGPTDTNFVVEIESDGAATLRFGDGTNGMMPGSNTAFAAQYRIGNGTAGNVGAESLLLFAGDPRIAACTNPLPATGGVDPETSAQIQRRAPQAFLTQERAVTMQDYINVTEGYPQITDAAATLRWTGSWYTVFDAAEPAGGGALNKATLKSLTKYVNQYRLAGQDLKLEGPDYVSLTITLTVCVDPAYFQTQVQHALEQVLGAGIQPNGQPGVFAPANFQLGQSVYLSPIYTAARSVAGVTTVTATVFQPQSVPLTTPPTQVYINAGEIKMGAFQVARMANDPSLPANGQLTLNMQGGK
jgi:Baseplate J-like protein